MGEVVLATFEFLRTMWLLRCSGGTENGTSIDRGVGLIFQALWV